MFPMLALFIIFLLVLTFFRRKSDAAQAKADEAFWSKERNANATRRKNLDELDYITIPVEKLPLDADSPSCQTILTLSEKRLFHPGSMTNTELKLQYGAANLEALSEYESDYIRLEQALDAYATELLEKRRSQDATRILEFAVSTGCDIGHIYLTLAAIYKEQNKTEQLTSLIDAAKQIPALNRTPFLDRMEGYLS